MLRLNEPLTKFSVSKFECINLKKYLKMPEWAGSPRIDRDALRGGMAGQTALRLICWQIIYLPIIITEI
jgi:hypothetical protein